MFECICFLKNDSNCSWYLPTLNTVHSCFSSLIQCDGCWQNRSMRYKLLKEFYVWEKHSQLKAMGKSPIVSSAPWHLVLPATHANILSKFAIWEDLTNFTNVGWSCEYSICLPKLFPAFQISYNKYSQMLGNKLTLQRPDFLDNWVMPTFLKIVSLGHDFCNTEVLCIDIYFGYILLC